MYHNTWFRNLCTDYIPFDVPNLPNACINPLLFTLLRATFAVSTYLFRSFKSTFRLATVKNTLPQALQSTFQSQIPSFSQPTSFFCLSINKNSFAERSVTSNASETKLLYSENFDSRSFIDAIPFCTVLYILLRPVLVNSFPWTTSLTEIRGKLQTTIGNQNCELKTCRAPI